MSNLIQLVLYHQIHYLGTYIGQVKQRYYSICSHYKFRLVFDQYLGLCTIGTYQYHLYVNLPQKVHILIERAYRQDISHFNLVTPYAALSHILLYQKVTLSVIYWPTRPYIATGVQAYFSLHIKAPILHWLVNDSNRSMVS